VKITLLQSAIKDLHRFSRRDQKFIQKKIFDFSLCENIFLHPKVKKLKIMDVTIQEGYKASSLRLRGEMKNHVIPVKTGI